MCIRDRGIPCIRRYEGGGNYLEIVFGQQNVFPIEIYVPEDALERAKEAIVSVPIDDDFEEADEEGTDIDEGSAGQEKENDNE